MSQVRVHNFSISLDGFGTGDGVTFEAPFGHAGERLHEWMFTTRFWRSMVGEAGGTSGVDHSFADRHGLGIGAEIMGRGKFGPQTGPWTDVGTDDEWRGWWGPNPPFHTPVFVLTHHPRDPLPMQGGTTFTFVTDGAESALEQARSAAGHEDVMVAGGANAIQQYLAAGLLDELYLHIVPTVLGTGQRLLEDVGDPTLEPVKVIASPAVTHVKYRVVR